MFHPEDPMSQAARGFSLGRSHKDCAVASNNSLRAGNTQQRAGHAAAVIQFSNALFWKSQFKRFSDTSYTSLRPRRTLRRDLFHFRTRASVIDCSRGKEDDDHLDVQVAVKDGAIIVTLPETSFGVVYRKEAEPWLLASDIRDDRK